MLFLLTVTAIPSLFIFISVTRMFQQKTDLQIGQANVNDCNVRVRLEQQALPSPI